MKKFASIILVLALMLSLSVPAFAVGPGDKVEVGFTYEVVEPKYMVEIPAGIELKLNQTVFLPVTVSGGATETLEGRKIVITLEDALAGASLYSGTALYGDGVLHTDDFMIVKNNYAKEGYYDTLAYYISSPMWIDGTISAGTVHLDIGKPLLQFSEDGVKNLDFSLIPGIATDDGVIELDPALIYPNSRYTGWIVFGVKIVN